MKMFKHITTQPFIFATGLAALIHSTWSLGTLFSGYAPDFGTWQWLAWIAPALLIAFALDVGQISTSGQIRQHGLTVTGSLTFGVFALATYYLQWLYIAHHMPLLELAPGISPAHRDAALWLRDMGMWFIPALLPLSTLLYTFSGKRGQQLVETVEHEPTDTTDEFAELPERLQHTAECPNCDWQSVPKDTELSAKQALSGHRSHCKARHELSVNGATHAHVE